MKPGHVVVSIALFLASFVLNGLRADIREIGREVVTQGRVVAAIAAWARERGYRGEG